MLFVPAGTSPTHMLTNFSEQREHIGTAAPRMAAVRAVGLLQPRHA